MRLSGRILAFHVVMESPFSNTLLKNICVCVCVVFTSNTLEWA